MKIVLQHEEIERLSEQLAKMLVNDACCEGEYFYSIPIAGESSPILRVVLYAVFDRDVNEIHLLNTRQQPMAYRFVLDGELVSAYISFEQGDTEKKYFIANIDELAEAFKDRLECFSINKCYVSLWEA